MLSFLLSRGWLLQYSLFLSHSKYCQFHFQLSQWSAVRTFNLVVRHSELKLSWSWMKWSSPTRLKPAEIHPLAIWSVHASLRILFRCACWSRNIRQVVAEWVATCTLLYWWLARNDTPIPIASCTNKQVKGGWLATPSTPLDQPLLFHLLAWNSKQLSSHLLCISDQCVDQHWQAYLCYIRRS